MKNSKSEQKFVIKKDTPIIEITERFPDIGSYLVDEYGFFCIGCPLSVTETIYDGALVHGLTESEAEELIRELNSMIMHPISH
ncbi:MAG: hypothetical protein US52_C0008G0016 [candidate division WS6 bacterium GW2011_GWA2_37_6]|uniref:DUF1858 domain-containing protein n=1 Tax=candidate division WS6 bacterium GW2011_GWA2_37_6 TaxID=1619087 RepID=A0A0G0H1W7_9BACT|nr:MAG: hypothetical protein US52_C0008G0016 [candidate division WS6 bacterium GW2011_GWA2_37_6]